MKKVGLALLSATMLLSSVLACSSSNHSSISSGGNSTSSDSISETIIEEGVIILIKYQSLTVGHEDILLQAEVNIKGASQAITWTSSDESVASVNSEGLLKILNIGETVITAKSVDHPDKMDSFKLLVTGTVLKGKVTSFKGSPISDVKITFDDKSAITNASGEYEITLNGKENSKVMTLEKEGFITRHIDLSKDIVDGVLNKTIFLFTSTDTIDLDFSGSVENVLLGKVEDASVKINSTEVKTSSDGTFNASKCSVSASFDVQVTKDGFVTYSKKYSIEDYLSNIENGNNKIDLGNVDLYQSQEEINIFSNGSHSVKGHVYRGLSGLNFIFDANWDISQGGFKYELFIDLGKSKPADFNRSDIRDSDFNFDTTGILTSQKYGDNFGDGEPLFNYTVNGNSHVTTLTLPYSYLKMSKNEIFGFNVISHDDGVSDRSFKIFGCTVEWYNSYSYPRVGLDNKVYQGNTNANPYDITSSGIIKSEVLGTIGQGADYQYTMSLAKGNNGLYIITDKVSQNVRYIQEETNYHIFLDTHQTDFTRTTDSYVKHFVLIGGRWLARYRVDGPYSVFNAKEECTDLNKYGIDFYAENGKVIIFIPYSQLGDNFTKDSTIGIAANIEEGSNNWRSWQAPYISGYKNEPHVEEIASFVRLDANLKVIK